MVVNEPPPGMEHLMRQAQDSNQVRRRVAVPSPAVSAAGIG